MDLFFLSLDRDLEESEDDDDEDDERLLPPDDEEEPLELLELRRRSPPRSLRLRPPRPRLEERRRPPRLRSRLRRRREEAPDPVFLFLSLSLSSDLDEELEDLLRRRSERPPAGMLSSHSYSVPTSFYPDKLRVDVDLSENVRAAGAAGAIPSVVSLAAVASIASPRASPRLATRGHRWPPARRHSAVGCHRCHTRGPDTRPGRPCGNQVMKKKRTFRPNIQTFGGCSHLRPPDRGCNLNNEVAFVDSTWRGSIAASVGKEKAKTSSSTLPRASIDPTEAAACGILVRNKR